MTTDPTPAPKAPSPVPRGLVAVTAVLVLAIGALLLVATSDDETAKETGGIEGLRVADNLTANHTGDGERIAYPDRGSRPPLGGNHAPIWQSCQAYSAPVPTENAVHSLEHGAVWITYRPGLASDQVAALDALAGGGQAYVLVSPYPGQQSAVTLTAWGRQLDVDSAGDDRVEEFVSTYADGPQNREVGAGCQSPLTQTGDVPFVLDGNALVPSTSSRTVSADGPLD